MPGADDPARVEIYNLARTEDEDFVPETLELLRLWDKAPDAEHRHRFIAELGGRAAGVVLANVDPHLAEKKGFMYGPSVLPEFRRNGIGTALARAAIADLRSRGMEQVEAREQDRESSNAFLASLGFKPVRSFSNMRRNLADLSAGPRPPGIEVVLVEPTDENLRTLVHIENEAFKEHFNYRPATLEMMQFYIKNIRAEGAVVYTAFARMRGEPVGYLVFGYEPHTFAHLGRKRGTLWDIGVLKQHRQQGVATALFLASMERLKSDGLEEAELYVDDSNVTGARRLYEKLGFKLAVRDIVRVLDLRTRET